MTTETDLEKLKKLKWGLEANIGRFGLFKVKCHNLNLQQQFIEECQNTWGDHLVQVVMSGPDQLMFSKIMAEIKGKTPSVLMVTGMEDVLDIIKLFVVANLCRDNFREMGCPMVLWLNNHTWEQFKGIAADFDSWAIPVILGEESD
jgi:hypothetical protein